jgi:hypothetical protein
MIYIIIYTGNRYRAIIDTVLKHPVAKRYCSTIGIHSLCTAAVHTLYTAVPVYPVCMFEK